MASQITEFMLPGKKAEKQKVTFSYNCLLTLYKKEQEEATSPYEINETSTDNLVSLREFSDPVSIGSN